MSIANKIFTNTVWQLVVRFFDIIVGVVNIGIIARFLGQAQFGLYTTIFVFLQTLMTIGDLGLYLTLLNEVSATGDKKAEKKKIDNIFTIRLVSSLIIFALAPLLIKILPYDPAVKLGVIFLAGSFFWQSLISTLTAVFAKYLDMAKATIVNLLAKFIYLGPLIYIYQQGGSLNQVLLWNTITTAISFFVLLIFLKKHVRLGLAWDLPYWRNVFHIAWPLSLGVLLNLVYFKADTLILSAYHSSEKVGLYGAAYKVLEVLVTFPHMFMGLILPLFVAAWVKKDLEKLRSIQQNTFDFFSIINVWLLMVVWLLSEKIMLLITGREFIMSAPILNILVLAVVAIFFGTMFTYLVVAMGLQKKMLKYYLIAATLGLSAYFLFIPQYGYWAAATITVGVEIFVWAAAYYLVRKNAKIVLKTSVLWRSIVAAVFSYILFWPARNWSVILVGFLISVFYFFMLFILRAVKKDELKIMLNK